MLSVSVFLLVGAIATSAKVLPPSNGYTPSSELETAPFEITRFIPGYNAVYEERSYPSRKWVCTEPTGELKGDVEDECFLRILPYIKGENEEGVSLEMTTPVIMLHDGENMQEMCFYIEEKHQNAPPKPTAEGVYISQRPQVEVYAVRFGGSASDFNFMRQTKNMERFLSQNELSADMRMHVRAGFNNPWDIFRKNEIWYMKA